MKKLKVNKPKIVKEGTHEGVIESVEYREKPFEYTDIVIKFENEHKIKAGYPSYLTPVNKLGRLLIEFGGTVEVDKEVSPEEILIGKKCSFMTMNETTKNGTFPKVVSGSLKPL